MLMMRSELGGQASQQGGQLMFMMRSDFGVPSFSEGS